CARETSGAWSGVNRFDVW
nr:immunoglobulin heavy chain junction region [Macaca mulatta]MOY18240.1 immunoglobulin heavy chain junction region [Macaca mulatta]MOY18600.1 immunoglobulin heavy chain junction region [Macaca mulatta]MOY19120.1 immunoglobulin heavy chain junction region [Macaca mulatta]MOY19524.1 immunoglobulin heavy chain junction region [Macaca mulatta]